MARSRTSATGQWLGMVRVWHRLGKDVDFKALLRSGRGKVGVRQCMAQDLRISWRGVRCGWVWVLQVTPRQRRGENFRRGREWTSWLGPAQAWPCGAVRGSGKG